MSTRKVVAQWAVTISDPNCEMRHCGFDNEGNAIIRKSSITIPPLEIFDFEDGAELQQLIEAGAVRLMTEMEIAQGLGVGDSVPDPRRLAYEEREA